MIFGFISDVVESTTEVVSDAIDVGLGVVTLGEYGELNKENVSRLIAAGMTIYGISEATGVAVDLIEKALED